MKQNILFQSFSNVHVHKNHVSGERMYKYRFHEPNLPKIDSVNIRQRTEICILSSTPGDSDAGGHTNCFIIKIDNIIITSLLISRVFVKLKRDNIWVYDYDVIMMTIVRNTVYTLCSMHIAYFLFISQGFPPQPDDVKRCT